MQFDSLHGRKSNVFSQTIPNMQFDSLHGRESNVFSQTIPKMQLDSLHEERAMFFHSQSLSRSKISKEKKSAEPNKTLRHCYQRVTKYRRLRDWSTAKRSSLLACYNKSTTVVLLPTYLHVFFGPDVPHVVPPPSQAKSGTVPCTPSILFHYQSTPYNTQSWKNVIKQLHLCIIYFNSAVSSRDYRSN
jgi:hypothetical protein